MDDHKPRKRVALVSLAYACSLRVGLYLLPVKSMATALLVSVDTASISCASLSALAPRSAG